MNNTDRTILQMKYARIIKEIADYDSISLEAATDIFYKSPMFQIINDGVANLYCLSDKYLAQEILADR